MRNKPKPDERRGMCAASRRKLLQRHMEDWLCRVVTASMSGTPYAFLKRLELSGLLFTHTHIFYFIYSCGNREAEADLPYSFIYCDLKDHSCAQVSLD